MEGRSREDTGGFLGPSRKGRTREELIVLMVIGGVGEVHQRDSGELTPDWRTRRSQTLLVHFWSDPFELCASGKPLDIFVLLFPHCYQ